MRRILSTDAAVVAKVDALGKITLGDDPGQPVGLARSTGEVYADEAGAGRVAAVDASGWVTDADYDRVGNIDASGLVRDRAGTIVGKVEEPVDGAVLLMILSGRL
ncbi:MAG: hypothetical protein M3T49_04610, partial [Candidatus Eremiobacteraeota bacterium]|nr:hypothetical protein [Candidatus Eremiobacteraeota bacterium]